MSMSPGLATTLGSALDILGHQQTGLSISLPVDPSALELHSGSKVKPGACMKHKGLVNSPPSLPKLLSECRAARCIHSVSQSMTFMGSCPP